MKRVALVTGASRGLGLECAGQLAKLGHRVLLTARSAEKLVPAVEKIRSAGGEAEAFALDVTNQASVDELFRKVRRDFARLDILVNNAGVLLDKDSEGTGPLSSPPEIVEDTFLTNVLGPYRLCRAFVPLMKEGGYGRIVNVSSGMGQLSEMDGGWPAYRISKTALNSLTRLLAREVQGANILVNAVCPGWVRTDMGGPSASRSVEEGARGLIWAATLADNGPNGGFFRDGKSIPW